MSINDTRGLWRGKCVDNNNEWVEGDLSRMNSADRYFIEAFGVSGCGELIPQPSASVWALPTRTTS